MARLFARSIRGERAVGKIPRNTGENVSLIGALSLDGLIATMSVKGSVDRDVFLTYLSPVLLPQLWPGAIVVMDNLKVHHATAVRLQLRRLEHGWYSCPPTRLTYLPLNCVGRKSNSSYALKLLLPMRHYTKQ
jgi:hypothetical protein